MLTIRATPYCSCHSLLLYNFVKYFYIYDFILIIKALQLILVQKMVVISEARGCGRVTHQLHLGKTSMMVAWQRREAGGTQSDLSLPSPPFLARWGCPWLF